MKRLANLMAPLLGGLLALSQSAPAQNAEDRGHQAGPPFVDLSLIGSDVIFSPEHVRYEVSADPGSYVTVFLISPTGRRSVLNPYESAVGGLKRRTLVRETSTGMESGEAYLVAVATRSGFHRSNLIRQSQSTGRLAGVRRGAEASLNELLNAILPVAGDDFVATYVSFRVIARAFEPIYTYAAQCSGAALIPGNAFLDDGFYLRRSLESQSPFADQELFFYSLNQRYSSACRERLFDRVLLVAGPRTPAVPPIAHRDTSAVPADTVLTPVDHGGPRVHPVDPDGPVIAFPGPASPGVGSSSDIARPRSSPLRIDPLPDHPVTPAAPTPVERREPVEPSISPPLRVHPVDRVEPERPQPVSEPTIRVEPPQTISTPVAPAPPPPPRPTPLPAPVSPPADPLTIPPAN